LRKTETKLIQVDLAHVTRHMRRSEKQHTYKSVLYGLHGSVRAPSLFQSLMTGKAP